MPVKVTVDSLLIHEFTYSLFIGLCSVTSGMTGYSHLYHSIKLIHCGAPQIDVLNDKIVFFIIQYISLRGTAVNEFYRMIQMGVACHARGNRTETNE